ncbi:MFS transporter [Sphingomonas jatrophae]|uniref:MFS transporter n=1 Tax=Sphingomonas jatrophae TaxID=1166337 RepID=UPI001A97C182|nr:MFS transporter [Sphingomonas jatrophae]
MIALRSVRPHRGWAVLAVAFLAQMSTIGSVSYGYGLLVAPLTREFGMSRADANGGLMLLLVGMGLASPLIGRLLDRVPARRVMMGGALLFLLGCSGVALLSLLWQVAAAALVVAAGAAALGPLTASTLAVRWFPASPGRALGIVAVSSSAGGLVMLPMMALLLEGAGWRGLVLALGVTIGTVITILALLIVRDPPPRLEHNLFTPERQADRPAVAALLRTRDFWLLVVTLGVVLGVDQALLASLIPYGLDRGFDPLSASLLVSIISGSAIGGKLLIGWLADIVDRRRLFLGVTLLTASFLALLLSGPSFPVLSAACCVVGAAIGGTTPLWGALIVDRFGVPAYGTVMGLLIPMQMPIALACLRLIGHVFDRHGRYDMGFMAFAIAVACAGTAMLALRTRGATPTP